MIEAETDMVTDRPARFRGTRLQMVIAILNAALLVSLPAIAADDVGDPCLELAGIGATIMEMRQADIDASAALDMIEGSIVENDEDRDLFGFLVTMAWAEPVGPSSAAQTEHVNAFGARIYTLCSTATPE